MDKPLPVADKSSSSIWQMDEANESKEGENKEEAECRPEELEEHKNDEK